MAKKKTKSTTRSKTRSTKRKSVKKKKVTLSGILRGKAEETRERVVAILDEAKDKIDNLIRSGQKLAKTHCPKGMKFIGKFRTDFDKEVKRLKKELKKVQGEVKRVKIEIRNVSLDLKDEYKKVVDAILHDHFFAKVIDLEKVKGFRENLGKNVEGQLTRMRSALGIPQNEEVIRLNRQINTLAKKVHGLSAK